MGSEEQEGRVKIPIRDKRKLHDDGAAQQGGAVVGEPVLPEPDAAEDPKAAVAEAEAKAASYLDDLQRLKDGLGRDGGPAVGRGRPLRYGDVVGFRRQARG
jgi:hypothetical protein